MFDKEQIIKAWECCGSTTYRCDECPIDQQKKDDCICGGYLAQCTLALHRELTKENEMLKAENERAHQAYYEIACEVVDLRAENERLKQLNKDLFKDVARLSVDSLTIEADTVRRMQERLKEEYKRRCPLVSTNIIDQIAEELLEEKQ